MDPDFILFIEWFDAVFIFLLFNSCPEFKNDVF